MCCPLVFEFSVGIGGFVIGLGQISFFFSLFYLLNVNNSKPLKFDITMFTVVPNIVSVEMGVFLDYKLYFFSRTIYSNRLSSMIDFG